MIAYKFLRSGGIGPFSGMRWPRAGEWTTGTPTAAQPGVAACRIVDLPWWLCDELWEIELTGPVTTGTHKLTAPAGRLRGRIDAWTPGCAAEYATAAERHLCELLSEALGDLAPPESTATGTLADLADAVKETEGMPANVRAAMTTLRSSALVTVAGGPALATYTTARVADRLDPVSGHVEERAWQARWLAERLGISTPS